MSCSALIGHGYMRDNFEHRYGRHRWGGKLKLSNQQKAEVVLRVLCKEKVYVSGIVAELPKWQKCAVARRKLQRMTGHQHFSFLDQVTDSAA